MKHYLKNTVLTAIIFVLTVACTTTAIGAEANTVPKELDQYLNLADDSFKWEIVETLDNGNTYLLEMTSQTWHNIVWKHFMIVALPSNGKIGDTALLHITGGTTGRKPGRDDMMLARMVCESSSMPFAILLQVPNQPLFGSHVEDSLIGETLLKAIETNDDTWPLLFPMTKSAIRAMDTVTQLFEQEKKVKVDRFVVNGASKRGWTTWLTGASKDPRVIAIAPMVIDNLNIWMQMPYQLETWGSFSESIGDYTVRNLVRADISNLTDYEKRLFVMIDPYSYRSRITMPKLLVHGTNDPYWTVDATQFYWDDLLGVKYILNIPNAGHNLGTGQMKAIGTLAVFAKNAAQNGPWPKFDWKVREEGDKYVITIDTEIPSERILLWTADSATKEFRKAQWNSSPLPNKQQQTVTISKPQSGHIAFYIEVESEFQGAPFSACTQVWRF